jgi:hypothetical protein
MKAGAIFAAHAAGQEMGRPGGIFKACGPVLRAKFNILAPGAVEHHIAAGAPWPFARFGVKF